MGIETQLYSVTRPYKRFNRSQYIGRKKNFFLYIGALKKLVIFLNKIVKKPLTQVDFFCIIIHAL